MHFNHKWLAGKELAFLFILTFIFQISCSLDNEVSYYTVNYQLTTAQGNIEIDYNDINSIVGISRESLYVFNHRNDFFNDDFLDEQSFPIIGKFEDGIIVSDSLGNNRMVINIFNDSIVINDTISNGKVITAYGYPLVEYGFADKETFLIDIVERNKFEYLELYDTIEFNKSGFVINENDSIFYGLNNLWNLKKIHTELFLEMDGYPSLTFQICGLDENELCLKYNGKARDEIILKIIPNDEAVSKNIIGTWIEQSNLKYPVPFVNRIDSNYHLYRSLTFTKDSSLIIREKYKCDTFFWLFNHSEDKIIIPDLWQYGTGLYDVISMKDSIVTLGYNYIDKYKISNIEKSYFLVEQDEALDQCDKMIELATYNDILNELNRWNFTSGVYNTKSSFYKSEEKGFYGFYNLLDENFGFLAKVIVWVEGSSKDWLPESKTQTVVSIFTNSDKLCFWNGIHVGMKSDKVKGLLKNVLKSDNRILFFDMFGGVYKYGTKNGYITSIEYEYLSDHSEYFKE